MFSIVERKCRFVVAFPADRSKSTCHVVRATVHCMMKQRLAISFITYVTRLHAQIQSGDRGSGTPLKKSLKYRLSMKYSSGSPEKSQRYQSSIQCLVIIGTPAKRHFGGGQIMAAYIGICIWILSPFIDLTKKCFQSWIPSDNFFSRIVRVYGSYIYRKYQSPDHYMWVSPCDFGIYCIYGKASFKRK